MNPMQKQSRGIFGMDHSSRDLLETQRLRWWSFALPIEERQLDCLESVGKDTTRRLFARISKRATIQDIGGEPSMYQRIASSG